MLSDTGMLHRWLSYWAAPLTGINESKEVRGEEGDSVPWEWDPRSGEEPREGNIDPGVTPPYEFCSLVKAALVRQDLANSDRIKYTWFHFSDRPLVVRRMYQIWRSCIWRYFIHLVMHIIIYIYISLLITYFQYISKDVSQSSEKGVWEPDETILWA